MRHEMTLTYRDGESVSNSDVAVFKGSETVVFSTDSFGHCEFDWPYDWIDRLEVDQIVVRRDWDISGGFSGSQEDLETITIARPDENRPQDLPQGLIGEEEQEQGVRGRIFYSDGTAVYTAFRLQVEFPSAGGLESYRYSTDDKHSYCHNDGEFFIATQSYMRGQYASKFYVTSALNSGEIPSALFRRGPAGSYTVILPPGFGKGGTKGGLITGTVIDRDGTPAPECKIQGEVRSSSFFPTGGSFPETYTDRRGRFQLPFEGGTVLKRLYIGGHEPDLIVKAVKGYDDIPIPIRDISAGNFNLILTRAKKPFFGIF